MKLFNQSHVHVNHLPETFKPGSRFKPTLSWVWKCLWGCGVSPSQVLAPLQVPLFPSRVPEARAQGTHWDTGTMCLWWGCSSRTQIRWPSDSQQSGTNLRAGRCVSFFSPYCEEYKASPIQHRTFMLPCAEPTNTIVLLRNMYYLPVTFYHKPKNPVVKRWKLPVTRITVIYGLWLATLHQCMKARCDEPFCLKLCPLRHGSVEG